VLSSCFSAGVEGTPLFSYFVIDLTIPYVSGNKRQNDEKCEKIFNRIPISVDERLK